jgi:hypothetical protein
MTIFELNENLKDDLVLNHGAWEAKSLIFKSGVLIIPEPFLETIVRWDKDTEGSLIERAIAKICRFRMETQKRCYTTPPEYEVVYGHPQVIWTIFKDDEDIFSA